MQSHPLDFTGPLDKKRATGQLKRLTPVRLERKGLPDAAHHTLAHPNFVRQGTGAPVRRSLRSGFQDLGQSSFHMSVSNSARGPALVSSCEWPGSHRVRCAGADFGLRAQSFKVSYYLLFAVENGNDSPMRITVLTLYLRCADALLIVHMHVLSVVPSLTAGHSIIRRGVTRSPRVRLPARWVSALRKIQRKW